VPLFATTGKARFVRVFFPGSGTQRRGIREIEIFRYDIDEEYYYIMDKYRLIWDDVAYTPGELRAVAYKQGEEIGETTIQTSGETAALSLSPDRTELTADGYDLSYILVEAKDSDGVFNPLAEDLVTFEIDGPAEIAGVGNGNQLSYEPFQSNQRELFYGKAMLIVRTLPDDSGRILITASCEGCEPASVTLKSR
jgi:beta-galactosidase